MDTIIHITTDWWSVGATVFSGILTATATVLAVIYTNYQTKKQLKEQEIKYELERLEQIRQQKMVVIKPTLLLNSFTGIMDKILSQNDYNRILLLSGEDGYDFFDDPDKCMNQKCRILLLENNTNNDIKELAVWTKAVLLNMDTEEYCVYETENTIRLLRARESIIIRLANQEQFTKIVEMNQNKVVSVFDFYCKVEYTTLADQRVTYVYEIKITNDRRIEVVNDGITGMVDLDEEITIKPTIFRNLQDYISGIDRSSYNWEKMGQAQMRGLMQCMPNFTQEGAHDKTNMKEKDSWEESE